jgi:hypothetical protein
MKNFIVFIIAFFFLTGAFAQKIGIKAGANFANAKWEDSSVKLETDAKIGLVIGLVVDLKLMGGFGINTGVDFSQKGTKWNATILSEDIKTTVSLNYIVIPAKLAYTIEAGPLGVFFEGGPYAGFAVSGKFKAEAMGVSEEDDIQFGSDDEDDLKGMDFGLSFGAGVYIGPIRAALNYDLGLANLENTADATFKNGLFVISVAYLIKK